jgi:hypothetical protein
MEDTMIREVTALPDGGAYAHGFAGEVWYLRGAEAVRVKEVSALSPTPVSAHESDRQRWLWSQVEHERHRRRDAEEHSDWDQENQSDQVKPSGYGRGVYPAPSQALAYEASQAAR